MLIRQRLRALSRALPHARTGDPHAIHQARVATRRLREALPVAACGAAGRRLERAVRRLTRVLGPVRELDVAVMMLDELASRPEVPRAAVVCLQQAIRDERARLHRGLTDIVDAGHLEKLTKRALAAARGRERVTAARVPRDPAQLALALGRAARRAERVRATVDNAAGIYLPDRLHDVRIAVKKLRYTMEVARQLTGSRARARIATLKRTQDLLGRMHDLEVLIARTRAVQGSPNAPDLRLSADLDQLVRRLEMECRQLHAQYIAGRAALLSVCDHAIASSVPASRRAGDGRKGKRHGASAA